MESPPPAELMDKLCFVTHWSCVDIRLLIQRGHYDQAVDLADIAEHIPSLLPAWKDEYLPIVVDSFRRYQEKYGHKVFDYVGLLLTDSCSYRERHGKWRSLD